MMREIGVNRCDGTISRVIVGQVLGAIDELTAGRRVVVITDSNVHRRYRSVIDSYEHIIIGLGETNKTIVTVERVYNQLIELNADRTTFILGFGGGIVTDVAGFVANTYMRGLPFGFVATTLLAQVDASVGGKNGVNVQGFKNMVGTFSQPEFVLCDTAVLQTLPDREFRSGMGELIKAAIIADGELFSTLENSSYEGLIGDRDLLEDVICAAIRVKAEIVGRDERETGERRKLNLGHTFAHAIEKSIQTHVHGEAVAIGTVIISELATNLGLLTEGDYRRIKALFERYGLPVAVDTDVKRLLKAIRLDKKRDAESINIVLPVAIGECVVQKLSFDELDKAF